VFGNRTSTTVAAIYSLSYTGTTWLNAIIGAHPRAFAVGPPDRVYAMHDRDGWDEACLVHGSQCAFWPAFQRVFDASSAFVTQLGAFADCDVVALNNPSEEFSRAELRDPWIRIRRIQLVRDGRAVAASYLRHHPGATFLEASLGFILPSFEQFYFDEHDPDVLCLRYEDLAERPQTVLPRVFDFLDLQVHPEALRFWERPQHLTTGNVGVIALMRYAEGLHMGGFEGEEFYRDEFARLQTDPIPRVDERWQDEITNMDRYLFDLLCGERNAAFGYQRDRFSLPEIAELRGAISTAIAAGALEQAQIASLRAAAAKVGIVFETVPVLDRQAKSDSPASRRANEVPTSGGGGGGPSGFGNGYERVRALASRAWRKIRGRIGG